MPGVGDASDRQRERENKALNAQLDKESKERRADDQRRLQTERRREQALRRHEIRVVQHWSAWERRFPEASDQLFDRLVHVDWWQHRNPRDLAYGEFHRLHPDAAIAARAIARALQTYFYEPTLTDENLCGIERELSHLTPGSAVDLREQYFAIYLKFRSDREVQQKMAREEEERRLRQAQWKEAKAAERERKRQERLARGGWWAFFGRTPQK